MRALLAAKDHVNVFLYDGAMVPDPDGIISSGHENKTARTVALRRGEPIYAEPLIAMFRAIIANNRAGGWRQLKAADRSLTKSAQVDGRVHNSQMSCPTAVRRAFSG